MMRKLGLLTAVLLLTTWASVKADDTPDCDCRFCADNPSVTCLDWHNGGIPDDCGGWYQYWCIV